MIKEALVHLATLLLVLSGMFLRAAFVVFIALGVLWLVGHFFPMVGKELGLPCSVVFDCLQVPLKGLPNNVSLGQLWPVGLIVAGIVMIVRGLRR